MSKLVNCSNSFLPVFTDLMYNNKFGVIFKVVTEWLPKLEYKPGFKLITIMFKLNLLP